jgi:fatty-acyl-CoA synthase
MRSYVHGATDVPLIGQTIGDSFDTACSNFARTEAFVAVRQDLRWSYEELRRQVDNLARALLALGIRKGDRIGVWSPNNAEWVTLQFATPKIGAILVTINPAYRASELTYALQQSGCRALVLAPSFKTSNYIAMLADVRAECPDLEVEISLGPDEHRGYLPWFALLERAAEVSENTLRTVQEQQQFDDPVAILYTSGTTGAPKGATLSHHNILNNGYFMGECCGLTAGDRLCVTFPYYHCGGMVGSNLACVTHGSTIVIPAESFDPLSVLQTVQTQHCTVLHGVPTMFIAELNHPRFADFDLSTLRTGIMAGAPCPVELMKRVQSEMHMHDLTIAYGMTETSPASFQTRSDDPIEKRLSTVGRIHPHVEGRIVDRHGNVLPRGEAGEVCARGYSVMLGYWNDPESTAAAIDDARWMHTGDVATMDDDGYVNIVGRIKDMIIRGGENIYPREIEELLHSHPAVVDAQVFGVPDELYGEEVCAWVQLKHGAELGADELRQMCRVSLAHFKVPRYVKFVGGYPMTVTGKVQKFRMRETMIDELGRHAAAALKTA